MTVELGDLDAFAGALTPDDLERLNPAPAQRAPSNTQRVEVVMESGERYAATLDARDRRAYALNAERYKLPAMTIDAANLDVLKLELLTMFSAWWATRQRLHLHSLDWPAFNAQALELVTLPDLEVEPHPLAPGAG